MSRHDEDTIMIEGAIVVWEGLKNPSRNDNGTASYELGVVIPPTSPDKILLEQLAGQGLQRSQWRGVMPSGGNWPVKVVEASELDGQFTGYIRMSIKTQHTPKCYSETGDLIDSPMVWGPTLFTGQKVDVLVNTYEYNNKQKGIAFGLQGFCPLVSAGASPISIGGGGANTAAAFGSRGGQPQQLHGVREGSIAGFHQQQGGGNPYAQQAQGGGGNPYAQQQAKPAPGVEMLPSSPVTYEKAMADGQTEAQLVEWGMAKYVTAPAQGGGGNPYAQQQQQAKPAQGVEMVPGAPVTYEKAMAEGHTEAQLVEWGMAKYSTGQAQGNGNPYPSQATNFLPQ
jgi:hypothetical protein